MSATVIRSSVVDMGTIHASDAQPALEWFAKLNAAQALLEDTQLLIVESDWRLRMMERILKVLAERLGAEKQHPKALTLLAQLRQGFHERSLLEVELAHHRHNHQVLTDRINELRIGRPQ